MVFLGYWNLPTVIQAGTRILHLCFFLREMAIQRGTWLVLSGFNAGKVPYYLFILWEKVWHGVQKRSRFGQLQKSKMRVLLEKRGLGSGPPPPPRCPQHPRQFFVVSCNILILSLGLFSSRVLRSLGSLNQKNKALTESSSRSVLVSMAASISISSFSARNSISRGVSPFLRCRGNAILILIAVLLWLMRSLEVECEFQLFKQNR